MASIVEEKRTSPFVALYREIFPENNSEDHKRMMRDDLIGFYKELLREENEKSLSGSDSLELKWLNRKMDRLNCEVSCHETAIECLESEMNELSSKISSIQKTLRKEPEGNYDEIVKNLQDKIQHVKKLYRQDMDFE